MSKQWEKYQLHTRLVRQHPYRAYSSPVVTRKKHIKRKRTDDDIDFEYWWRVYEQQEQCDDIAFDFSVFLKQMASQILYDETMCCNRLCSPFSLFCSFLALACLTEGDTQAEIYHLLGCHDYKLLLTSMLLLLQCNCYENGEIIRPASSLWFDDKVQVQQGILDWMFVQFGTASFSGNMKDNEYCLAATSWLNDMTSGQLQKQLGNMKIKDDSVLLILTSMLLKAKWEKRFSRRNTQKGVFHAATEDYECQFMNDKAERYIWFADGFKGLQLKLEGIGCIWFLLPDDGKTPNDIINIGDLWSLSDSCNIEKREVTISIPKFDMTIENDITANMKALGIHHIFSDASETPYTTIENHSIKLADIKHDVRLKINEEGCTATAYTVLRGPICYGTPPPLPKMDFILDRPFIVTVYGMGALPLFAGVVNKP